MVWWFIYSILRWDKEKIYNLQLGTVKIVCIILTPVDSFLGTICDFFREEEIVWNKNLIMDKKFSPFFCVGDDFAIFLLFLAQFRALSLFTSVSYATKTHLSEMKKCFVAIRNSTFSIVLYADSCLLHWKKKLEIDTRRILLKIKSWKPWTLCWKFDVTFGVSWKHVVSILL